LAIALSFSVGLFFVCFEIANNSESHIVFIIALIVYSSAYYAFTIELLLYIINNDLKEVDDFYISSVEKENFVHSFIFSNLFVVLNLGLTFFFIYPLYIENSNNIYHQLGFIPVVIISFYALYKYWYCYLSTKKKLTVKALAQLPTPFQKALQQCETKIADFSQKLQAAKTKLQQLPTIEYLNEKEKQAFSQQISQSQTLYQNQLNNYASSFFKLHLSQQKQQLGTIINEVFYQNKEVDGNELNVITENINSLLAHDYWQYTDMDKRTYQALLPILNKLKKVDQRETFAEQVADLAPTKDLLNLDDHELQTQIELADLKNTENLAQQTLTEFTQSTQLLNDELARLQAENEVTGDYI